MEQYKDFCIAGQARPGPPYYTLSDDILYHRPDKSIVERTRFTLGFFNLTTLA